VDSTKKNARVAGLLYLSLVVTAPWRLIYIPSTLFVPINKLLGEQFQPEAVGMDKLIMLRLHFRKFRSHRVNGSFR
jgi:hypothetical protein